MAHSRPFGISRGGSVTSTSSSANVYTYYSKTFDDINDLFIYACTHGDYMLVYRLLKDGEAKADTFNKMGKSVLQLAIENEHLEVVRTLLDKTPYEQFRDALLLAIYLDHTNIANFILKHPTYQTFSGGFLDPTDPQAYDDSQFSSDITPLILAAQHNRLSLVHYLLSKGERIKKPHANMCACAECIQDSLSDSFRQAQIRLSAYRGLSSEVYIALTYPDPILQAFELGQELRQLAKSEHHFYAEYKKLANQLSMFVARLLDNVRGHEELEIVLNKTGLPHEEKYESLARFDLAIQYKEKPFVSHSNCQQKLTEKWYANLSVIQNAATAKQIIFYLGYMTCFPFVALIHYVLPGSKIGSLCRQPNLKFKAYIASYFTFIALIIASSYFSAIYLDKTTFLSTYNSTIYANYIQLIYRNTELRNAIISIDADGNDSTVDSFLNCDVSLRFMQPNPFEIAISIWVIGFFWNEFKQIASVGFHVYLKVPSNYVDCFMNILYIFYFIFLYSSIVCTRISMNTFHSAKYWSDIARYRTMSDAEKQYYIYQTRHVLYWLNADRFYWQSGDIQDLAEAFFAMGNVTSICRICFLLPIIPFVGPLQVMLDRVIIDISKWIIIITIFFVSFACALHLIYSYFSVVLQQRNALQFSPSYINSSISTSSIDYNYTLSNNSQCPDYFYALVNQSIAFIIDSTTDNGNTSGDNTDSCQQSSNYKTHQKVGSYPAVYYFGRSFEVAVITMFFTLFSVFGEAPPDRGYELLTLSCYQPGPNSYRAGFDSFVSNLGFVLYGGFTFVCVTVLINTLIAMLEQTIEAIDDRSDIEWKFARSKLYMEYIRDGDTLPVPFNILPSPTSIMKFLNRIKEIIALKRLSWNNTTKKPTGPKGKHPIPVKKSHNDIHTNGEFITFNNKAIFNRKRAQSTGGKLTYIIVIERVIKRFLLYYKDPHIGLNESNDGFEIRDIKNDISALHFELFNEIDRFEEMRASDAQSMNTLNETINEYFDLEQIKRHLMKQQPS